MKTIKDILLHATNLLHQTSSSPRLDSELLLSHCLSKSRTYFFTYPEQALTSAEHKQMQSLLEERVKGTPIAYMTGQKEFWSLMLKVTTDTLIPRPETELLVETALTALEGIKNPVIIELGTGSGAIAIALASERSDSTIYASDISEKALTIAKHNAQTHQIKNISFMYSNWLTDYPNIKADLIISNPPYIAHNCPLIETNVKNHEPSLALFSNENGYHDLLTIIEQSKYYLRRQGTILLEHGINQEGTLAKILNKHGFISFKNHADLQGINRCVDAKYLHSE